MTSFSQQLRLLLWKNFTLRKRHKVRLVIELAWPCILFIILMWVRTRGLKQHHASCHLVEKALPSVGGTEFLQNYLCTLNNTCHKDYVENLGNGIWKDSMLMSLILEASPHLEELASSKESLNTVGILWNEFTQVMKAISAIYARDEIHKIGTVQLREFMGKRSQKAFVEAVSTYTVMNSSTADNLLSSKVLLDNLSLSSFQEVLNYFLSKDCNNQTDFAAIKFSDASIVKDICDMDGEQKRMLFFLAFRYLDKGGLVSKLKRQAQLNGVIDQAARPDNLFKLDFKALSTLDKLARVLMKTFDVAFKKFGPLNGTDMFTALVYDGLCGIDSRKMNSSTFGFDPGSIGRYDTLRDYLKDWNPDHHYEFDHDISNACNSMFQNLESYPYTALLWRQLKPIIRGVIYYAPETEFTRNIMGKVMEKFSQIREIDDGIKALLRLLHRSRKWLNTNGEDLQILAEALSDDKSISMIFDTLNIKPKPKSSSETVKFFKSIATSNITSSLGNLDFTLEILAGLVECVRYNKTKGFPTELEAVNEGHKLLSSEKLWAVIIFENVIDSEGNETTPSHLKYKIRMDSDKVDGTRSVRDRLTSKTPRRRPGFDMKYFTSGFIYLQEMIEHSIIEVMTGETLPDFATYMQQFPYPCYIFDQFIRAVSRTFPLFMTLSWVYASSMIIKSIVMEKELRLKEVMKVMGMGNGVIWVGWFVDSLIVMSFSASILCIILKYGKVIEHSDVSIIWIFMMSYTVATISFSFLVSTFFTRANSAAAAGGILFFVSFLPYNMLLIWEERLTWYHMLSGCLISNVAFGFGCTYFSRYEEDGIGAQWEGISLQTLPGDDFNLSYCIIMLWFDAILYWIITWYVEAVFPGAYGVPKPWNFFMKASYWTGKSVPRSPVKILYENVPENAEDREVPIIEDEPEDLKPGVVVRNLGKTYSNGKVALRDLTINFYENQITSFLGHNGAGKTTTMSILTGLFPPSRGTARIYGLDISKDMDSIRQSIGICPQYNTLFDRLTVEEHMKFYAGLKGKLNESFEEELTKMLQDLGIPHKRHEFPTNLSGGMKRKLSVACSFIGGPTTVVLDEPTTGVDPYSRRSIWELLLKYKQGRTIIMSTHFMDEADVLGDRIAIISQGKLKACGSSLFLKSHFGQGYSLRLVKQDPFMMKKKTNPTTGEPIDAANSNVIHSTTPTVREKTDLVLFVKEEIKEAVLVDDVGTEVILLLPYDSIPKFPVLFQRLDDHLDQLGITSYGISDTTLEDVFLNITVLDLEANAESAEEQKANCKRRVLEMYKTFKGRVTKRVSAAPVTRAAANGNVADHHPIVTVSASAPTTASPQDHTVLEATRTRSDGSIAPNLFLRPLPVAQLPEVDAEGNFLRVAETSSPDSSLLEESCNRDEFPSRSEKQNYSCCRLAFLQISMIYLKRVWNSSRNKKAVFFEIFLPAVFIFITLLFTLILPPATDEPPRELTLWTYTSPNVIFLSDSDNASYTMDDLKSFKQGLLGPTALGTACVKDELARGLCNPKTWSNVSVQEFESLGLNYSFKGFDSCSCASGTLQCPKSVGQVRPPKIEIPTSDEVFDVSRVNIPEWIEKTYRKYQISRYGGFQLMKQYKSPVDLTGFLQLLDQVTGLKNTSINDDFPEDDFFDETTTEAFNTNSSRSVFKVWFENRGWVSSVAYLNALHNVLLREYLPPDLPKEEYGITLTTHPMNLTKSQQKKESFKTVGLGLIHAVCVIFALSFVPASFTVYLIEERTSGAKHLHLVSGVRPLVYWISNFLYDLSKYSVPVVLCLLLFVAFDAQAYIGEPSILSFICLLTLYGWASIPAMYPFSFFFSIPSTAFVVLACTNLFIGIITTISVFVLEQFGDPELEKVGNVLKQVFLVFPHYCLGRGLQELVKLDVETRAFDKLGMKAHHKDRFLWDHLGKMLFFLMIHGFAFFLLNLCFEYRQWCYFLIKKATRRKPIENENLDEDVLREKERIIGQPELISALRAEKLTKYYGRKVHPAVNGITFAVERGECFGLLGVNGAGKTSCFKMLTGDVRITWGRARICNSDVETNLDGARRHFGYCPQEDGLDPLLNAHETLRLYARMRGMTPLETKAAVPKLIQTLGLTACAKRSCGTYSGGNRRKLSTAVALISDPDVVFLDEPTSGMDPASRRKFWKVILRLIRIGKSVILTSHSMEECEALCTRIAIMVNGEFTCLGSLTHLKNRFGDGYTVTIRCSKEKQEEFQSRFLGFFVTARLDDKHCSQMKFSIPQDDSKLSDIFNRMYNFKEEALIEDYSVSQTTLDDIFVKFASGQKDELDR